MIRVVYCTPCRDCGWYFISRIKPTGSKWTDSCGACIRQHT